MNFPDLAERLAVIRERIRERQARGGWTHPVRIVAVTKSQGPEAVRAAVAAGLTDVGENRVQEALGKQEQLAGLAVRWHLIGSLQRNKARQLRRLAIYFRYTQCRESTKPTTPRTASTAGLASHAHCRPSQWSIAPSDQVLITVVVTHMVR